MKNIIGILAVLVIIALIKINVYFYTIIRGLPVPYQIAIWLLLSIGIIINLKGLIKFKKN